MNYYTYIETNYSKDYKMQLINDMTKENLEMEIFENNDGLYEQFDEQKFLSGEYSRGELIAITSDWIQQSPDTL